MTSTASTSDGNHSRNPSTLQGRCDGESPRHDPGPHRPGRAAASHRRDVPVEHHDQRDGQPVLCRGGASRSKNWEALLFGSLDPQNFITVDKPPVSQWVMGLSGQIFGFSSASMLIPEALMAVATVALLYAAVARSAARKAGLFAGAALALTPVAALMFRFNNPDAVMVLLMMAAAYCAVRAMRRAARNGSCWLASRSVRVPGQDARRLDGDAGDRTGVSRRRPDNIAPPTAASAGVTGGVRRVRGLVRVGDAAWPASSRPYIAGSTDNSFMDLVLGYNGFARVLGRNHGVRRAARAPRRRVRPHPQLGNQRLGRVRQSDTGLRRLFSGEFGFEIGWLLPAALLAIVLVLISRGRAPRTDLVRGGVILFGGWMVVDGLVLSYMHGMIHPYYCLSLAPAVAGMFAIGMHEMWLKRTTMVRPDRDGAMLSQHRCLELLAAAPKRRVAARVALDNPGARVVAATGRAGGGVGHRGHAGRCAAGVVRGAVVALAGSAAYAIATIGQPHSGGGAVGRARAAAARTMAWRRAKRGSARATTTRRSTRCWRQRTPSGRRRSPVVGGRRPGAVDEHRGDGDRRVLGPRSRARR